ncbi:MAG: CsiV family protein [Marinagarivorans sp.]|nr:CsiV family protein [Marinagarivorans sp.]
MRLDSTSLARSTLRLLITKKITLVLFLLTAAASFISTYAAAQSYQVETIIFERIGSAYNADEIWRKKISLSYPLNYRSLISPNSISANTDMRTFVIEIPEADYALKAEAYALRKKSGYRILFHKAWQQTLTSLDKSPAVVITGGDKFDDYYELSGSLRIGVSKFLHVSTDLWLTQFTPNLGNTMDIPYLPLSPDLALNNPNSTLTDSDYNTKNNDFSINSYSNNDNYLAKGTVLNTEQRNYLPLRVITTTQSARMRSMELNYIDHPRIGVLIKITPLSNSEIVSKESLLESVNDDADMPTTDE